MKTRLLFALILVLTLDLALGLTVTLQGAAPQVFRRGPDISRLSPDTVQAITQYWVEVIAPGFGDPNNLNIYSLASFGGQLYAGTWYSGTSGAQVWRQNNTGGWTSVTTNGFGNPTNNGIDHMLEFNGQLYASTEVDGGTGGEVWRSSNGLSWTRVVSQGFGNPTNSEVIRLTIFSNTLYASTWSYTTTHGTEIWRTNTGNAGGWTRVVANGFGDANNSVALSSELYNGYLYAGTVNATTGGEVWRTNNGITWTQVNTNGFGTANNRAVSALDAFNGYLYAGALGKTGVAGVQLWRCQVCNGTDWAKVVDNGFGDVNNSRLNALAVFSNYLYFVVGNYSTGMQVWRSMDGTNWERDMTNFSPSSQYNGGPYWDNSVMVFNNRLYMGTTADPLGQGGNIWASISSLFLPMVVR